MSSGSGDMGKDDVPQPRQPKNLQDLVRYSIEAGSTEGNESLPQTSEERRKFLEEALQSLCEDVTKEVSDAISIIKMHQESEEDLSTYESALDYIADRVDSIDCANDFCKLGGLDIAPACLSSSSSNIRWRMCDIIAQCTQNNTFSQEEAVKHKLLQPLLSMVDKDVDAKCRTKAFFAVSNMVRDFPLGLKEFMELDGFSVVLRSMQSDIERLRNKSTFFMSTILLQQPNIIGDVYSMGFVEQLVSLIQREHSPIHEHIILTLLTIAQNHEPAQIECRRPELSLRSSLNSLLEHYQNDDAFEEEISYVKQLIKLVFSDDSEEER